MCYGQLYFQKFILLLPSGRYRQLWSFLIKITFCYFKSVIGNFPVQFFKAEAWIHGRPNRSSFLKESAVIHGRPNGRSFLKRKQGSMDDRIGPVFWKRMQGSMDGRISPNSKRGSRNPWTAESVRIQKGEAGILGRPNRSSFIKRKQGSMDDRIGAVF